MLKIKSYIILIILLSSLVVNSVIAINTAEINKLSSLELREYNNIITSNSNQYLKIFWSKTQPYFDQFITTKFIQEIEFNKITQRQFDQFLKVDIIYLKELGEIILAKASVVKDAKLKSQLQDRGRIYINSYNKYKNLFNDVDQLLIGEGFVKRHLNFIKNLSPEEIIIATLPSMILYRGMGIYLDDKVSKESPWRNYVDKRIRPELVQVLYKYTSNANEIINKVNADKLFTIFFKTVLFEIEFLNHYQEIILGKTN